MSIQPFPLNQLGAMADKQTLACIAGTVMNIYKPKSGENSNGPWSIQNAVIKGTDGTELTLWIKDREEIPSSAKGRFLILTAKQGDKGLSGLYIMDDEYNGKITRKIKVTPTAELAYQQDGHAPQARQESHGHQAAETTEFQTAAHQKAEEEWKDIESAIPQAQSEPVRKQTKANAPDSLHEAKKTILQITNLHLLCARAVVDYEAPQFKKVTGQDMTESMVQGATGSIFIESCRNGLHRNMPTTALE